MEKPFFIQPWLTSDEFISCYETMFSSLNDESYSTIDEFINSLNIENLKVGYSKLVIWEGRNDNKAFVLSSLLLLDSIIKIKENKFTDSFNKLDAHHILGEIVIRVTNLLIDELKKKKKKNKSSMFLVAKEIKLPEYIIEIRHASTHKNIPSMKSLQLSVTFLFKWVKENMWDKLYISLKKEYTLYTQIKECFQINSLEPLNLIDDDNENNNAEDNEDEDSNDNKVKLEINHLMDIVQLFFICWKKSFYDPIEQPLLRQNNDRNTSFCEEIFEFLDNKENELFIIFLFKFITQQMKNILFHNANNYLREIDILVQFSIFLLSHQSLEKSDFKQYEILLSSIYSNLKAISSEIASFTKIFNNFKQIFPNVDSIIKKSLYENDELDIIGTFNLNNTPNEDQPFNGSDNNIVQIESENNVSIDQVMDDKNIYDTLIL